jgi:hypothetical protein
MTAIEKDKAVELTFTQSTGYVELSKYTRRT